MNTKTFMDGVEKAQANDLNVLTEKGIEYTVEGDRFAQFYKAAELRKTNPAAELVNMATKHFTAIDYLSKRPTNYPIAMWREKTTDLRNYMHLLEGLLIEMMACGECTINIYPGKLISVDGKGRCKSCGKQIMVSVKNIRRWDKYFHTICQSVAAKSPCLSRKIGAILVKDHSIVSTGYNGPPRGIPHCKGITKGIANGFSRSFDDFHTINSYEDIELLCPRKAKGYPSGTHLELCPAQHAEENTVSNAARLGVSIFGSTLYLNSIIPCKNCFGTLINAGIVEIVVETTDVYDKYTQFLIDNSNIKIREFELGEI